MAKRTGRETPALDFWASARDLGTLAEYLDAWDAECSLTYDGTTGLWVALIVHEGQLWTAEGEAAGEALAALGGVVRREWSRLP